MSTASDKLKIIRVTMPDGVVFHSKESLSLKDDIVPFVLQYKKDHGIALNKLPVIEQIEMSEEEFAGLRLCDNPAVAFVRIL